MKDKVQDLDAAVSALTPPLNTETYTRLRRGIFESADVDVMVNGSGDFAFLHPRPSMDYSQYEPRAQRLGLKAYKSSNDVIERRLKKVGGYLVDVKSFLEIGASDGSFLQAAQSVHPELSYACIEPDQATRSQRDTLSWLRQFEDFAAAHASDMQFEAIGLFHVFEHIEEPSAFLAECAALLAQGGRIIIEVPSLSDPLLGLYDTAAYRDFYFQWQHPYVYSGDSLGRVLEHNGFTVQKLIPYQRYGIENHLTWLSKGEPGGSEDYRRLFTQIDEGYRAALEASAKTDTVIAIAEIGA